MMWMTSRCPFVVISPTFAPRRCSMAFVPTVVPSASRAVSRKRPSVVRPSPSAARRKDSMTPSEKSSGVDDAFAVVIRPSASITTQSVKVPPVSIPMMQGMMTRIVQSRDEVIRCPSCSHENADTQKFCGECGARLGESLPAPAGAYTPPHLADSILTSRSAREGERKLVTVVFCDIANSTPLASRLGADAMHALLNRFFELALAEVHRYEGTINQFLGDGFMALFGAPVAHEDHARRAL